jgi:DNA polymerase-4
VESLPVGKFHGIGPATSAKSNAPGVLHGFRHPQTDPGLPAAALWQSGAYYYWISRGIDDRPARADRIRKSVGAENTFSNDLTQFDAMAVELQPLVDKVWTAT